MSNREVVNNSMHYEHLDPTGRPLANGLYDPAWEHDSCGVGFVAHIKGNRSHDIVRDAARMLTRMEHRGGCGCEANTGDGAGILTSLPHEFLAKIVSRELGATLPETGRFAAANVFLPKDVGQRTECQRIVEEIVKQEGQAILGWRELPHDPDAADLGATARDFMPAMSQLIVVADQASTPEAFERSLFLIRKIASHRIRGSALPQAKQFYICSLSSKVLVYKGMLSTHQIVPFFPDLADADYISHLAMVHSRFSTNTFPSWDRAQPLRWLAHNGEINTLKGNANWMRARQGKLESELFGDRLERLYPIVERDCSDSGNLDNVLELLAMTGRSLAESVMMMIPEAWQNHDSMSAEKRAFYEYHSALQEPWDGPASISFTDGTCIGAVLDRNGLRPSRYYVTSDDRVIMASEVGVLEVEPQSVIEKGRLEPGRMFLVDFEQGRIISDDELKQTVSTAQPYGEWIEEHRITLDQLEPVEPPAAYSPQELLARMQAFGYTTETMQFMLVPLVKAKKDPIGSMGNDSALACLSDQPRMIYDYFKQLFAQVTNPAIDSIREEIVMSLRTFIGPEGNLLSSSASQVERLTLEQPILSDADLAKLEQLNRGKWRSRKIDITMPLDCGKEGLVEALDRICHEASTAIRDGMAMIILSDRDVGPTRVPVSALLATGAVHQHLVKEETRTQIALIVESGEAREVHHHCCLIGYGADAINPYLAYQSLEQASRDGLLRGQLDREALHDAYCMGVGKGILKVLAKMGISTLHSYKGAQIFEAVGLDNGPIERCFTGTASRIKGVDFDVLAEEANRRHAIGFPREDQEANHSLPSSGEYHWRRDGEQHAWNPFTISELQQSARSGDKDAYHRFSKLINEETTRACHLRGLLTFREQTPIDVSEVEPASEIVKRFCTGAMSYGSISAEAHETLAIAMNRIGGKSNTGEGGEDYQRFEPLPNGDSKRSAIKQIASGRFGVTSWYLTNADELQIKIAQGAKPGEGGELPGHKVNEIIAATRMSTPGVGLISPPPHHDIYSIEDLAQLIFDLKNANPGARISVKLVSEVGVGTIAAGVAKGHADNILVSGTGGGTGASPLTSIKHAGMPWELGIAETHQTLVMNDLRSRVRLQTDGQLKTGRDVVIATLLGAEEYGFSTAPLITLGCIMMRKCHLNTCPVGIATQDPELREKFSGKPEHVINYLFMVAEEARELMASLGFRTIDEMVGRVDILQVDQAIAHWKKQGIDLTLLLTPAEKPHPNVDVYCTSQQDHGLEDTLDQQLIRLCRPALETGERVKFETEILNTDRATGTTLSHHVSKRFGAEGLPDETIHIKFRGSAGQSLGAWLAPGVSLEVEGDANDYVGKGLSGGRIAIYPPESSPFEAEANILIGNVALYGATSGEAYFRGIAAERFCVRNSGATTVVEGVGDHGCEYMTGGRAVILGKTGRNFAAGMSGGIAYIYDPSQTFADCCNGELVDIEDVDDAKDVRELKGIIEQHVKYTGSTVGKTILEQWENSQTHFRKVMPRDYKRALAELVAHAPQHALPANLSMPAEPNA